MKTYYTYVVPDENWEPVKITMSLKEILRERTKQAEKHGNGYPYAEEAIWEFRMGNWAYLSDKEGREI
jgi:hypothetical protein